MNFNHVFAPTARANRLIEAHAANLGTYALIIAVIALTSALRLIDWLTIQIERVPEYQIRYELAKVRAKRWVLRQRIAFHSFTAYNGLDTRFERIQSFCKYALNHKAEIAQSAMDAIFALN